MNQNFSWLYCFLGTTFIAPMIRILVENDLQ